tara:strand:+ start:4534 stop:5262 length:729 start_codon:yes stop_codon:yes gene_type:complete
MKLGIFGDSFAGERFETLDRVESGHSWVGLLRHNYDIINYARAGTALSYSYFNFLQNYTQFDSIIFIVSNVHRRDVFKVPGGNVHVQESYSPGISESRIQDLDFEENIKNSMSKLHFVGKPLKPQDAPTDWNAVDLLTYYAMISHIKALRPDVKLIHGFSTFTLNSMMSISSLDICKFNLTWRDIKEVDRFHHMSKQQNVEVADNMHLWLKGKLDFNNTLGKNIEKFYTKSKTLEIAGLALI